MSQQAAPDLSAGDSDDDAERRAAADPLIGLVVADRYRILSHLGSGGMGVVYKVEHTHIGKLMAMKLLSGELSRDPTIFKRFKREALAASKLSHPSTVQVFDFGQANNLTYLIMELVPGDDLSRVLRREGPMPFVRVAKLMVQVCGSLSEAHAAGIIHRDLKPENVLVMRSRNSKEEIPKVCDFGVAKLREATEPSDVTNHGAVVGTPYYMSPEQIRGEDVDVRTDIYALGGMMYRLLTGHTPFEGPNPMAVFAKHLTEPVAPPSVRAPTRGIPRAVDALLLKTLAKQREERFASVDELQRELVDLLRASNASSVDILIDQDHIKSLASQLASGSISDPDIGKKPTRKAATRDEVAAYERKLAIQRFIGQSFLFAALVGAAGGAWYGYKRARDYLNSMLNPPPPEGFEVEPNNSAQLANVVPFGKPIQGHVGKRASAQLSDRDFFSFEVPQGTSLARLSTTALPNFATCTWLYRSGMSDPLARFCSGAPRRDLLISAYRVEPGRYLLAVLQDTEPYSADAPPPTHENISDPYKLSFEPAQPDPAVEVEPNDNPVSSHRVALGGEVRGVLSFVNDEDVFCPESGASGPVKWTIKDAVERPRPNGTILDAALDRGGMKEPLRVLVHRAGAQGKIDALNVSSPHTTPSVKLDGAPGTGCLRLRLSRDPWSVAGSRVPSPGDEFYSVKLEVGS